LDDPFRAFRIHRIDDRIEARLEPLLLEDLNEGPVVVAISWSSINYKDALAATGAGSILRRYPLVGGIDLAGIVVDSADPNWQPGDEVLVCGSGLSETRDGGYAAYARVDADALVALPVGLTLRESMIIGTAGLTAALAVDRLQRNGLEPDRGPVAVTGATGGVGSFAIDILSGLGYEVVAITGKADASDYLRALGASSVVDRHGLAVSRKPLEAATLAAAVDSVGGDMLGWLLQRIAAAGAVASVGLAGSAKLETTVLPFILRGVSLLGIHSVTLEANYRANIWSRLASDWKPRHLDRILTSDIPLEDLPAAFTDFVDGRVRGRRIVRIGTR
jgi:acrylyl-CoA reductase (NADPH)